MSQTKFFEVIKPDHNFEFIGRTRLFMTISVALIALSFVMLPINHFMPGRRAALNYSIEFRGGTEMTVEFSGAQDAAKIREALESGGFPDAEPVKLKGLGQENNYILRFGAVSAVSEDARKKLLDGFRAKYGEDLRKFEFSEGGDKLFLRFAKNLETNEIGDQLKGAGVGYQTVNRYGRPEDNTFEIVLISINTKVQETLDQKLGTGAVKQIVGSDSVGAKAGRELRDDGITSLLAAILLIMVYIAIRFDFRYGPGTVVALLHDAVLVMGAFAISYKSFSLTTVAAILTVIGYSMNDTIVVFDRIRENTARERAKRFDRVVNTAINETLSRTILTSLTVFLVSVFMWLVGIGPVSDFGFAMTVGVVVGTYSSIFVAAPVLIWLNDRFYKNTSAKPAKSQS